MTGLDMDTMADFDKLLSDICARGETLLSTARNIRTTNDKDTPNRVRDIFVELNALENEYSRAEILLEKCYGDYGRLAAHVHRKNKENVKQ